MNTVPSDRPTKGGQAKTFSARYRIVTHPAFRLGVLDARAGRPLDHDHIIDRIEAETPKGALERLHWSRPEASRLFDDEVPDNDVALAQYRYEEGRLVVLAYGLRCKAWGHPDYPPRQVMDLCMDGPQEHL